MKPGGMYKAVIFIAILVGAIALFSLLFPTSTKPEEIPLSEVIAMSQNSEIEKIVVEEEALLITATDGSEFKTFKEANANIYDITGLNLEGVVVEVKGSSGFNWGSLLINFLPLLLFGGMIFSVLPQVAFLSGLCNGLHDSRTCFSFKPMQFFSQCLGTGYRHRILAHDYSSSCSLLWTRLIEPIRMIFRIFFCLAS